MSNLEEKFQERYKNLNKEQKKAVDTIDGPVLVVAGPGTGKTELLSMRVANILRLTDINPESILCLTFTESGKDAMHERLSKMLGSRADQISIFTFHGFCGYLKNRYAEHFWKGSGSDVAGELTEYNILENIFKNLPHTDPLRSFHSEEGYSFLRDTKTRIKDLKEAGILPEDFLQQIKNLEVEYKTINSKLEKFIDERISEKIKVYYQDFLDFVNQSKEIPNLKNEISESLQIALDTNELSAWKTKFTESVDDHKFLKGTKNIDKMYSLQRIYEKYLEEMQKEKYIDYADIILNTLLELKRNPTLRTEVQEFFQYILVDEFQDTNNSQFEILKLLTTHPVHEGRPNIMVVGDDDQAVYRFQGGNANNLLEFKNFYKDVLVVVLENNYRSHQNILDLGKKVIENTTDRLTKKIENFNKNLISFKTQNSNLNNTPKILNFENQEAELNFVCTDILQKLQAGIPPGEIAIIAKKHKQLEEVAIYLNKFNIEYSYEKETSLLENPQIEQILTILRCVNSHHSTFSNIENYIPQILSFPFWQIERQEILQLGLQIRKQKTLWYTEICNSENSQIKKVGEFLTEIINDAANMPLYHLIDKIIQDERTNFKNFYFQNKLEYINFINNLKTLYDIIKVHKRKNILYTKDIESVLENIATYNINLSGKDDESKNKKNKISLLTSHKSKGLEFDSVYLIGTNKKFWGSRGKSPSLSFILGMPYTRYKEEESDFIRSLFVAVTRAKSDLTITHTENLIQYIENQNVKVTNENNLKIDSKKNDGKEVKLSDFYDLQTYNKDELEILQKYTENYKISPTHLNNFLDLSDCGPKKFLQINLLHFPTPPNEHSLFGTLIHNILEIAGKHKMQNKKDIPLKTLLTTYKQKLEREILNQVEFKKLLKKGEDVISNYYEFTKDFGILDDKFEISFGNENIDLDGAKITGNIDRIQINEKSKEIIIYDYKTGSTTFSDWDVDEIHKIKLFKYRNQLLFYKILLENHKLYKDYKIKLGVIDFLEIKKGKHNTLSLDYNDEKIKEELQKLKKLIVVIYNKIINLDFPDTAKYPENLKGILQFENDLLDS